MLFRSGKAKSEADFIEEQAAAERFARFTDWHQVMEPASPREYFNREFKNGDYLLPRFKLNPAPGRTQSVFFHRCVTDEDLAAAKKAMGRARRRGGVGGGLARVVPLRVRAAAVSALRERQEDEREDQQREGHAEERHLVERALRLGAARARGGLHHWREHPDVGGRRDDGQARDERAGGFEAREGPDGVEGLRRRPGIASYARAPVARA